MTNKKIFKLSALVFIVAILIVFSISCKNKVTRANNLTLSGEATTEEVVKVDDNKDISQFENKTYKSNIEKIGPVSVVLVAKIVTPEVNESYLEVRYTDPKDENRESMPDDLRSQIPILYELIDALGISRIVLDNYEADDIIGYIAERNKKENIKTIIYNTKKQIM